MFAAVCTGKCKTRGPTAHDEYEALSGWKTMMGEPHVDLPDTDLRDRVDRMVAAAHAGYYGNQTPHYSWDHPSAVLFALAAIEAIDKMLADRERR